MILEPENFSDLEILAILRKAQVLPKRGDLVLQRYPLNHTRHDTHRRISFRIWAGNRAIIHLIVGRSLGYLNYKTEGFCRNNPEVGCRALFFFRHESIDFLGQECPSLINLTEAYSSHQISSDTWRQSVLHVAQSLASTTRPSTMAKLMQEMVEFEQRVLAITSLTRLDQVFLRETIFPLIRTEASRRAPVTAWTNGDFTAKNILRDEHDRARLIDYEFARRTHFPESDWFRLWNFSRVPEDIKLEDLCEMTEIPPWRQIRGWLEHAVMMNEVCMPSIAQADLPKITAKLAPLVEAASGTTYNSVFFSFGSQSGLVTQPEAIQPNDTLVVEWSRQNSLTNPLSSQVHLVSDDTGEFKVTLGPSPGRALVIRLKLPPNPGLVDLRRIEVRGRDQTNLIWAVDPIQLASVVTCSGNLLESSSPGGLSIVHFGGDSFITLPVIRLSKSETVSNLVLGLRYVPNLSDFSQRLRRAFVDGDMPNFLTDGQTGGRVEDESGKLAVVTAQLYIPEDGSYLEDRSIRTTLSDINTWIDLSYDVPPLPVGSVLRFDPADQTGVLEIASITLEPVEHSFVAGQFPSHSRVRSWMSHLTCEGDSIMISNDDAVRILSFGTDANLKLAPLTPDVANRRCKLRVSLYFSPVVPPTVWAKALQDCRDSVQREIPALPESAQPSVRAAAASRRGQQALRIGLWLFVAALMVGTVLLHLAARR